MRELFSTQSSIEHQQSLLFEKIAVTWHSNGLYGVTSKQCIWSYIQTVYMELHPNSVYGVTSKQFIWSYIQSVYMGLHPNSVYGVTSKWYICSYLKSFSDGLQHVRYKRIVPQVLEPHLGPGDIHGTWQEQPWSWEQRIQAFKPLCYIPVNLTTLIQTSKPCNKIICISTCAIQTGMF